MHRIRVLASVAIGGVLAFATLVVLDHALAPRLDPLDHMLSEYANAGGLAGAFGIAALFVWGASWIVVALLCMYARRAGAGGGVGTIAVLLVVAGVGLAVAAVCPTQAVRGVVPAGVARTTSGRLHDLGAGLAQLAIFAAAVVSVRAVAWPRHLRRAVVAILVAALVVGPTLAALDAGARGLRQRALVTAACAWELALATTLARRPEDRRQPSGGASSTPAAGRAR